MKKVGAILAALTFLVGLVGCSVSDGTTAPDSVKSGAASTASNEGEAGGKKEGEKVIIGCTVYYMSEFVTLMVEGIEAGAAELGAEIKLLDADRDPAKQMSQVEGLIADKVDVLLVAPVHSASSVPVLELANNAKIPVVILNTELDTEDDYYFVGPNDVEAGELLMQYIADKMEGSGNIVILEGPIGHSAQIQRRQGIQNILDKNPEIKILTEKTANWNRDEAITSVENWMQAYAADGIDAVVCENDDMALGAVQALEAKGVKADVLVGGVDAVKDAAVYINDGRMDCTVLQDAGKEGRLGVDIAYKLAMGQDVAEYKNLIAMDLIIKEDGSAQNLLDTIFAD